MWKHRQIGLPAGAAEADVSEEKVQKTSTFFALFLSHDEGAVLPHKSARVYNEDLTAMIPTSGFNLQELALAKEDARIRARRERDEERRHRFLNARTRIMGLDAAALDEQVQEMRRSREDAKESDRLEKLRMIQISNMLEQAHEEEKNMRRQQLDELKQSWESEIEAKRARAPEPYVLDLEQCGPASAQNFGNDEEKDDRKSRIQKEEMRTWVKDALIEKKHRSVAEREEDMRYAALLQALDGYREVNGR